MCCGDMSAIRTRGGSASFLVPPRIVEASGRTGPRGSCRARFTRRRAPATSAVRGILRAGGGSGGLEATGRGSRVQHGWPCDGTYRDRVVACTRPRSPRLPLRAGQRYPAHDVLLALLGRPESSNAKGNVTALTNAEGEQREAHPPSCHVGVAPPRAPRVLQQHREAIGDHVSEGPVLDHLASRGALLRRPKRGSRKWLGAWWMFAVCGTHGDLPPGRATRCSSLISARSSVLGT